MVELLKQPQYKPMSVCEQVMSLFAGTRGFLDAIPIKSVQKWEREFIQWVKSAKADLVAELDDKKELTDDITSRLTSAIKEFNAGFKA